MSLSSSSISSLLSASSFPNENIDNNDNIDNNSDIEMNNETVSVTSSEYTMEPYEEYESLFGNPMEQDNNEILNNVNNTKWPKQEIVSLFQKIKERHYEMLNNTEEQDKVEYEYNKIIDIISIVTDLENQMET